MFGRRGRNICIGKALGRGGEFHGERILAIRLSPSSASVRRQNANVHAWLGREGGMLGGFRADTLVKEDESSSPPSPPASSKLPDLYAAKAGWSVETVMYEIDLILRTYPKWFGDILMHKCIFGIITTLQSILVQLKCTKSSIVNLLLMFRAPFISTYT